LNAALKRCSTQKLRIHAEGTYSQIGMKYPKVGNPLLLLGGAGIHACINLPKDNRL
jgi:hypothetical protein